MNWSAGNKVFETEKEARDFARELRRHGILCVEHETDRPVTHLHLGNGITEILNIKEVK